MSHTSSGKDFFQSLPQFNHSEAACLETVPVEWGFTGPDKQSLYSTELGGFTGKGQRRQSYDNPSIVVALPLRCLLAFGTVKVSESEERRASGHWFRRVTLTSK